MIIKDSLILTKTVLLTLVVDRNLTEQLVELCAEELAEVAPARGATSRRILGSPTPDPDPDKFFVELKLQLNRKSTHM